MEFIARILLPLVQAYSILLALLGAHRLRRRYGLDLFFILIGGLIVYMWWLMRLNIDVITIENVRLPVSSVTIYSAIFSGVLLVYIADGIRMARRLILGIIAMEGLLFFLEVFTYLLVNVKKDFQFVLPDPLITPQWTMTFWSAIALVADMMIVVVAYQFLQNHFPKKSNTLKLFIALSTALLVDSFIYVIGIQSGEPAIVSNVLMQGGGKLIMAALIAPPLAVYVSRETSGGPEKRGALDLFRSVDLLSRSLHYTKAKFDALVMSTPDAVVELNSNGFVKEGNQQFFKLTGYDKNKCNELHYSTLVSPDDRPRVISDFTIRMKSGKSKDVISVKMMAKNGQAIQTEWRFTRLEYDNTVTGLQVSIRDVSHTTVLERQLADATKLAATNEIKSDLMRALSKDIRTWLAHQTDLSSEQRDSSAKSTDMELTDRIDRILEAVDGLEPLDDKSRESVACSEFIKPAIAFLDDRIGNISLKTDYGNPEPTIVGNAAALTQVFMHLIDNATHWASKSQDDPSVEIFCRYKNSTRGNRKVEIRVRDNGLGFTLSQREHAYDPFVTSDPEHHSGFGLAFCKYVIEDHGGTIQHSRNDDWTEITVILPAEDLEPITETLID